MEHVSCVGHVRTHRHTDTHIKDHVYRFVGIQADSPVGSPLELAVVDKMLKQLGAGELGGKVLARFAVVFTVKALGALQRGCHYQWEPVLVGVGHIVIGHDVGCALQN